MKRERGRMVEEGGRITDGGDGGDVLIFLFFARERKRRHPFTD